MSSNYPTDLMAWKDLFRWNEPWSKGSFLCHIAVYLLPPWLWILKFTNDIGILTINKKSKMPIFVKTRSHKKLQNFSNKKCSIIFCWKKTRHAWSCCFSPKVFKATSHCAARARTDKTWLWSCGVWRFCAEESFSNHWCHVGFVGRYWKNP